MDKPWELRFDEPATEAVGAAPAGTGKPWEMQFDGGAENDAAPSTMDYAHGVSGGFNRGLANLAGAPVDLVNLGLRQIGLGSDKPFLGSESIKGMMEGASELATGNPEAMTYGGPDTPEGRVLSRMGEEFGAAALPSMALMRAASATGQAARAAPSLWESIAAPIRNTPGRALTGEMAATAGAGVGAGLAREIDPGNATAETMAQLIGGMTPAMLANTPSALGVRAAKRVYDKFSPDGQAAAGRDAAREAIGGAMTPEARAELQRAEDLTRAIPGFNPTLGEATNSPALLATQRDLERGASGADLERFVGRRRGSEQAITDYAAAQAPGGEQMANPVDYLSQRFDSARERIGREAQGVQLQRQGLADTLAKADRKAAGQTIRNQFAEAKRASSARMSQVANELGLNDTDFSVPFSGWRRRLVDEFSPRSPFDRRSDTPSVLNVLRDWDDNTPITFTDLRALRERVTGDLLDELGRPDKQSRLIRSLVRLRERTDDMIDDVTEAVEPSLAQRYRDFRTLYREQHIERFEAPTPYNLGKTGPRGFFTTSDEDVASHFFNAGDVTAAREFNNIFRGDTEARAALDAAVIDDLRVKVVRDDGTIDPRKMSAWYRRHESVLDEFPDLRERLGNLRSADDALLSRQAELVGRRKTFENDSLVRAITAYAAKGQRDPRGLVQSALNEPKAMHRLWGALGNNEPAREGLRRLVWDSVSTRSGADLAEFLASRRPSLRVMFGEPHLKALDQIAAARAMLDRTPMPGGQGYEPRPLANVERAIGQGIPQLSSRLFAFHSGRVQKGYLAVDTFMRGLRGRAQASAEDAFKAALYDRKVAESLLETMKSGNMTPATARRLRTRLFALGLPYQEREESKPPALPPLPWDPAPQPPTDSFSTLSPPPSPPSMWQRAPGNAFAGIAARG